ncbi:type II secretion system F family protein [Herminiimonas sp. CN]|uniref:type II secretion system F family protein n=1 Tax=Herminiimonas sp. CN TaxID=1349818 RepID=UPI000473C7D8|nr:type II secretion system F family protein [Herminiimonas sp. CN]
MEFRYQAINRDGQILKGEIQAGSQTDAVRILKGQDLTPVEVIEVTARPAKVAWRTSKSASAEEKAIVIRELATLLAAGVPLAEAVDSTARARADSALGSAFGIVYAQLRGGAPLSKALQESGLGMPDYLFQLVEAGELTGKLAQAMHSAADQMEYEEKIRQEMRNALIYPSILVFSGIAATLLIFVIVVPKFTNMLKNTRAKIPDISIWVLKTGLFVKENLLWFGLGTLAVVLGLTLLISNQKARRQLMEALSRLPLIGDWLINTEIGRWASMLGTLLENKVPIVRAMELAEAGVQLSSVSNKLHLAVRDLRAGKKLADALALQQTVNPMGINLVRVGERTGELPGMLQTLGRLYENASRERMKRFLILLEPITILTVGCVIGFIMVAIMLAITSLSTITL